MQTKKIGISNGVNIGIIIQARMGSTRLPGKVLKKLAGKEILWHVVKRCQKAKQVQQVIVATSTSAGDDIIYNFCKKQGFQVYRGSLNNVLKRYYKAAEHYKLDVIVRITSDCPLIDPGIIDSTTRLYLKSKCNYASNILNRNFPRGLDCEVFSFAALENANKKATYLEEKEHVTPYIINHNKKIAYPVGKEYMGKFRLTVDEINDYKLLKHIYDKFYKKNSIIDVKKVISYLKKNPRIANINQNVKMVALKQVKDY